MTNTPPDPHARSSDDVTIDPESTDAAGAEWLAELRAQAQSSNQPMSQLLTDDMAEPSDLDDGTIAPEGDAMDAIRAAVAEARSGQVGSAAPVLHGDEVSTASVGAHFSPPEPVPIRQTDSDGPVVTEVRPSDGVDPVPRDAPRWEPPPRLAPADDRSSGQLLTGRDKSSSLARSHVVGIVAAAVALTAALTFVLTQVLASDTPIVDDPETDTDTELPVDSAIVDDNPIDEQEE